MALSFHDIGEKTALTVIDISKGGSTIFGPDDFSVFGGIANEYSLIIQPEVGDSGHEMFSEFFSQIVERFLI